MKGMKNTDKSKELSMEEKLANVEMILVKKELRPNGKERF